MGVSGFLISWAMRRATSCHAADFCARRQFREIVEHEHIASVGAARTEGTDRDREVQHAAADHRFDFARDDSHAQRAAHQVVRRRVPLRLPAESSSGRLSLAPEPNMRAHGGDWRAESHR